MNRYQVTGRLTTDIEIKSVNEKTVVNFTGANNESVANCVSL